MKEGLSGSARALPHSPIDRTDGAGLAAAIGSAASTHRLISAYFLLSGLALLFPERPAAWKLFAFVHMVCAVLALWAGARTLFDNSGLPTASGRAANPPRDWTHIAVAYLSAGYPLLLLPLFYGELPALNQSVYGGTYFDDLIMRLDSALFGGQPSQTLAGALPLPWLSELLHASYLAYYVVIYAPPLLLLVNDRFAEFREAVFTVMLVFFVHYLFFIYFPVQGPRYLNSTPVPEVAQGLMFDVAHWVLERGSSQGAAFPSSHAAVAIAQVVVAARFLPRLVPLLAAIALGLSVGAVYGGFHYATDMIVGLTLGSAVAYVAPAVANLILGRRWTLSTQ